MIFDAVFALIFGLLSTLVGVLPEFTIPSWSVYDGSPGSGIYGGAGFLGGKLSMIDGLIPMDTLALCITVLVGALAVGALVKTALFVYEHIPGKAS